MGSVARSERCSRPPLENTVCELFAMSARFPTTIHLSLDELARHGGATGPHRDGWGLAFVQDGDALVVREPEAASESRWLAFLQDHEVRSAIVFAHIRRATQGDRHLRNTQPFTRELGGSSSRSRSSRACRSAPNAGSRSERVRSSSSARAASSAALGPRERRRASGGSPPREPEPRPEAEAGREAGLDESDRAVRADEKPSRRPPGSHVWNPPNHEVRPWQRWE